MIREARSEDAEQLGHAHATAAREAYGHYFPKHFMDSNTPERRAHMWSQLLAEEPPTGTLRRIMVAEQDGQILGFGAFGDARDDDAPLAHELWRLYVLKTAYGTGLSRRLLHALNPEQASSYLWVMQSNPRAIGFYRKHGYQADGTQVPLHGLGGHLKIRMTCSPALLRLAHGRETSDHASSGR